MRFPHDYPPPRKLAFSLVELSIVLVTLGLLVGGVLSARALIRANELRSIVDEYQNFKTAQHHFYEKYLAQAGDMANATDLWGAADPGTPAACRTALRAGVSGTLTCNGDGNGVVSPDGLGFCDDFEHTLHWQHLANAGFIGGRYSGATVLGGDCNEANSPKGKISTTVWAVTYDLHISGSWYTSYGVGAPRSGSLDKLLPAQEMWGIDSKIDDGKPGTGMVRGSNHFFPSNCSASGEYLISGTAVACAPHFLIRPR